ncbi:MAG TPA: acetolactate synthase small subunit [Nitrososphaerales archaeon]|nr:acetolactate synthase small subunit [Nitrososphaerales archaeon]
MSARPAATSTSHIPSNTSGEEVIVSEQRKPATQIVYAIVENQRGVLHRISGMFRAKGFNITSISIGETSSPDLARMTIIPKGDDQALQLLVKQLEKMIDVIEVGTMTHDDSVARELALVKFETRDNKSRNSILDLSNHLGAKAVDFARDSLVVEYTATPEKIDFFIEEASKSGAVKEVVRTGLTALRRGL